MVGIIILRPEVTLLHIYTTVFGIGPTYHLEQYASAVQAAMKANNNASIFN